MTPLVLYHRGCLDGYGAAYAAWCRLGEAAEYRAVQYGEPAPSDKDVWGRDVYILDFSYSRWEIERIASQATHLVLLDHHKTAEVELRGLPWVTFDMEHSGAVLAWKHFFPKSPVPRLLEYIEDRDLWRWQLHDSKAVSASLRVRIEDFRALYPFHLGDGIDQLAEEGYPILRAERQQVKQILLLAEPVTLHCADGGHVRRRDGFAVNSPILRDELGEALAIQSGGFGAVWRWHGGLGLYLVSLRSAAESDLDVSAIAKACGGEGGGHARAAGFSCMELPWWSRR